MTTTELINKLEELYDNVLSSAFDSWLVNGDPDKEITLPILVVEMDETLAFIDGLINELKESDAE